MRIRHIIVVPCVLVLLAACSDGPSQEDLSWEDSPLDKALGAFYGSDQSPEEWEREEQERQRETEELVAVCMAEEGFEYTPVTQHGAVTVWEEDEDWDTAEWAQQYGYGVTTDPWAEEAQVEPEEWVDPNEDYVMTMSQSEQDAYYAALYGEPEIIEDDGEWVEEDVEGHEYDWEDAGCQGRAQHEVYGEEQGVWEDPAFTEFFEAADQLYMDVQQDPRVAEVNAEWAGCMADAGISGMTTPDEAAMSFYEERDRLYMAADEQVDWDSIDWENVDENFDHTADLLDQGALADLKEREIATAVADFTCQEELGTLSRVLAVQFEHEEKFVETFQAEIAALAAAYGQDS